MRRIKKLVKNIDEELCGAKHYAECYIEKKSENSMQWASRFKEMSNEELKHANYLHDLAVQEINQINTVFKPTQEMEDAWDKSHKEYVEKAAWIRQMLAM